MKHKISDLKFRIDKLVPVDICKYFIDFYEKNTEHAETEASYKHQIKSITRDNYNCINLTKLYEKDKNFSRPLNLAKMYIKLMITNYTIYIQKEICPTYDMNVISDSYNIRILKYEKGQSIKDHIDVAGSIRASCTLNLNEDYEGGEFRFFNGQEKISFKTGDALIFPTEPIWIHGTEPITKGVRYSINCFLHA
jgi:hypothetical protein|tara:strand:- start:684 stop:1265 length:582 start_codon:yes stop_codon:yes gene_type:complete